MNWNSCCGSVGCHERVLVGPGSLGTEVEESEERGRQLRYAEYTNSGLVAITAATRKMR
jgi:hypothetical protein